MKSNQKLRDWRWTWTISSPWMKKVQQSREWNRTWFSPRRLACPSSYYLGKVKPKFWGQRQLSVSGCIIVFVVSWYTVPRLEVRIIKCMQQGAWSGQAPSPGHILDGSAVRPAKWWVWFCICNNEPAPANIDSFSYYLSSFLPHYLLFGVFSLIHVPFCKNTKCGRQSLDVCPFWAIIVIQLGGSQKDLLIM